MLRKLREDILKSLPPIAQDAMLESEIENLLDTYRAWYGQNEKFKEWADKYAKYRYKSRPWLRDPDVLH